MGIVSDGSFGAFRQDSWIKSNETITIYGTRTTMKTFTSPYFILFMLMARTAFGQNNADASRKRMMDSIKYVYLAEAAVRNPALRRATMSTDVISRSNIRSYIYGDKAFEGKISQVRTVANLNVPVKSWGKNHVSASFTFVRQHFQLEQVTTYRAGLEHLEGVKENKLTVGFTASFARADSLFGKGVVYTGLISGLTNNASTIQKINYLAGVIFMLKRTAETNYNVGLMLNIDPSINVPVFPVFSYWHKYKNDLELNLNFPQQLALRKPVTTRLWTTFGTSLSGAVSFFKFSQPGIPQDVNYTSAELKTGPGIEYRIAKKWLFGLSGGILTPIQVRAFERTGRSDDYFLNNKINTTPFINFSISLLPFL